MIQRVYHRIKPFTNRAKRAYHLVGEERDLRTTFDMPTQARLWLYRHGFTSRAMMLYDLDVHGTDAYLSDFDRYLKSPEINGDWSVFLDNKLSFYHLLSEYEKHRVSIYGVLRNGCVHPVDKVAESGINTGRWVRKLLDAEGALVVKPITGGGGKNVHLCRISEDGYQVNGEIHTGSDFETKVGNLDEYLVCEFVEQADYARTLYPGRRTRFGC
jgi:hypothetical protein